ncbi:hypothetical protein BIY37_01775 [Candidatus Brocadia sapporoensis]|uniref:Uncharacterized protein n=1 Tax=Candidatus Brocadia sapporoensis TaxID=392547 RepID=A0A1V6M2X9_9BACT|nr:hypothetical protein BIY37_01775 [Candidatus Brocadia sapporoensis]
MTLIFKGHASPSRKPLRIGETFPASEIEERIVRGLLLHPNLSFTVRYQLLAFLLMRILAFIINDKKPVYDMEKNK